MNYAEYTIIETRILPEDISFVTTDGYIYTHCLEKISSTEIQAVTWTYRDTLRYSV